MDRAVLRASPNETRSNSANGVVTLVAHQVRTTSDEVFNNQRLVDVHPRPIEQDNPDGEPENLAHAQIEAHPNFESDSQFKKLKEALARLATEAGWTIAPDS